MLTILTIHNDVCSGRNASMQWCTICTRVTAPIDDGQHRENYRLRRNRKTNQNNLDTRINLLIKFDKYMRPRAARFFRFVYFGFLFMCWCARMESHTASIDGAIAVQTHKVSWNGVRGRPQGISRRRQQNRRQHRTTRVVSGALLDTFSRCKILMFTFFSSFFC